MHFNPIYEELKAKVNLWSESNEQIYTRRKIVVKSVLGHITVIDCSVAFALGLAKVQNEFGIIALANNLLKLADLLQQLSKKSYKNRKTGEENHSFFFTGFILVTY